MAEEQKQACNRIPFETTSSCDRGSVDIYTFSDLPICKVIDPIVPLAGPPTVDLPVVPFTPPPCACFNIKTATTSLIEDRKDILFNATFNAEGDCCEGNYDEKFDIKIPCMPFEITDGDKPHPVTIKMDTCGAHAPPSGTFNLGITKPKNKCELKVNPSVTLNLPRPPTYEFDTSLDISTVCGLSNAEGTFSFINTGDSCEKNIKAKLNLTIPRPKEYTLNANLDISTVCQLSEACGDFSIEETDRGCGKDFTANLSLKVPKPIKYDFKTECSVRKVCYSQNWTSYGSPDDILWFSESGDGCSRTITQHLKMDIPCIQFQLSGADKSKDIDISYGSTPKGKINLNAKIECCKITLNPNIKLTIPNPKTYEFSTDFYLNTQCGIGNATGKFFIVNDTGTSPGTTKVKARLELNIPTPPTYEFRFAPSFTEWSGGYKVKDEQFEKFDTVCQRTLIHHMTLQVPHVANITLCGNGQGGAEGTISAVTISGGIDGFGSLDLGASLDSFGFVTSLCPSLKLTMPCPLNKLTISGESEQESQPYFYAYEETPSSSGCAAKWKGEVRMPAEVFTGDIKVLTGFAFTGTEFQPKIGTFKFKHGLLFEYTGDSPDIKVAFAQHTKC